MTEANKCMIQGQKGTSQTKSKKHRVKKINGFENVKIKDFSTMKVKQQNEKGYLQRLKLTRD